MATVASQLTRIHDVEGSLTLTSIGGGAGASANAEIFIQGSQSAGRKQSNATDHGFWLQVASVNVSAAGVHIGAWVNHIHYAVLTKLALRFGSSTANYHEHQVPLSGYPATGGWVRVWINVARTPEATGGTFDKTAMTQLAVLASLPAVGGNAPNLILDASDHATGGLLLTGTGGVWNDFVAADEGNSTNKYGVVLTRSGVIFCLARLTFGSASSLAFSDSGFVVVFPDQALVASTFMGVSVDLQHASTSVTWTNGVLRSAGTVKGDLVVTGTAGAFAATNTTLAALRIITLTSACTLTGCLVSGSGLITAAGAALLGCSVIGATGAVALFWNTATDTDSKLDGTTFVSGGSGHGIELGPNTPDEITFTDIGFSGYGANDTTDAAVFNNSGKALTINIVGGTVPTVRNGTGASTDLVTGVVTHSVTGLAAGSRVVWIRVSDDAVLANESEVSGVASYTYTYTGDVVADVSIIPPVGKRYKLVQVTLGNTSQSLPASQENDPFYFNPA